MRFCPWRVAQPERRVSGSIVVVTSEKPRYQDGSHSASRSKSSHGSRSMPVSPPHGGTTAATSGSTSSAISSSARASFEALT